MRRPSPGVIALSAFFDFGAVMAGLTCFALLFPDRGLEFIWRLKPEARAEFIAMGRWAVPLMAAVSIACALSAVGLFIRAEWGRRIALTVLGINLVGDAANAVFRGDLRTLIGLPIGGAMIAYLMSRRMKEQFAANPRQPDATSL